MNEPKPIRSLTAAGDELIDKKVAKLVNYASGLEQNPDDRDIAFSARVFAQVSLPYRDPKDVEVWQRKSGNTTLSVRPALFENPDGTFRRAYPYGLIPRHALTWMATEAFNTKSPELELGRSMSQFMENIGLAHTGNNAKRLTEQLRRLFDSQIKVEGLTINEHGAASRTTWIHLADDIQLWFANDPDQDPLPGWKQSIRLSDQFYRSIIDAPVPLDMNAVRALGSSPMRLDLYLWLTYRMSYLERTTRVTWEQLNAQFGSQYSRIRAFKEAFLENLRDVKIVYPDLNVDVESDFIVLRRSNTHVPKAVGAKPAKLILEGDRKVS